jgi:hypothetical protein
MSTLMPQVSDALLVHDAAHQSESTDLHDVALKLLRLTGLAHVAMEGEKLSDSTESELSLAMPGAVMLEKDFAAITPSPDPKQAQALLVGEDGPHLKQLGETMPKGIAVREGPCYLHKRWSAAYELWAVKVESPVLETSQSPFELGEYWPVGQPRKHGVYKFPAVAKPVSDDFKMYQVHKDHDEVVVFDVEGKEVSGFADVIDQFVAMDFPPTAIFQCVWSDGKMQLWDVLEFDGMDCTPMTWDQREHLIVNNGNRDQSFGDWLEGCGTLWRVNDQDALHNLDPGRHLIRYAKEKLGDTLRPFWFIYDAGKVTPGIVLPWVKPTYDANDDGGYIKVADTGLPYLQIHKNHRGVSVFVSEGGRDRASQLPKLVDLFSELPEDFVMEAVWTCDMNGLPISADVVQSGKVDISDCDLKIYPFDLVYWGDEDLSGMPMYDRIEMLEKIVENLDKPNVLPIEDLETEWSPWLFVADSVRPLAAGPHEHCFVSPK